ncbi:hypothetical protein ANANG_G00138920 [Anguilla anguilla]|uniref:Uncharacterized protein n=1 Tax=Anguilla anguilla TaxID=7936 RepID=A0A9D3MDS2_ANGAN|nr:hypothetical protein ANANG_G00138920 [Anguilla anguilla]
MLLLPAPQDYAPTPSISLCLDPGDPPPSLPLCAFPLAPQAGLVCNETGAGTGLEEGHAGEFCRFEGNIPGFINYFLNPGGSQEEELRPRRGSGGGECGGRAETCRAGSKRVRQKKEGIGEKRSDAGWEVLRIRPGNGVWHRGWIERAPGVGRVKTGRGGGVVGSRSNIRAGPSGRQPIKIRFKRRSEMWELVSVAEKGRVATPRSRVSRGRQMAGCWPQRGSGSGTYGRENTPCRTLNQDGFPIIKRQKGRPRARPLPFPALSHHLFKALTLSPPSDNPLLNSSIPFPPTLGPTLNLSPTPNFLHTLPLPPPTPVGVAESDKQIEKLLENVMMELPPTIPVVTETKGSHSNGLNHKRFRQPHVEAATTKVTAAGPTVLAETVLPLSSPCGTLEHHGSTTTMGELNNILDSFLWTFENQMSMQSMGETAVMEAGNDRNTGNATLGLCSEPGSCLAITMAFRGKRSTLNRLALAQNPSVSQPQNACMQFWNMPPHPREKGERQGKSPQNLSGHWKELHTSQWDCSNNYLEILIVGVCYNLHCHSQSGRRPTLWRYSSH